MVVTSHVAETARLVMDGKSYADFSHTFQALGV